MKSFRISGFKAFGEEITLDFGVEGKSMMLYGENGAGKSSIYEALQMVYYGDRLLSEQLTIGATPEQRDNEVSDFYFAYRHRPSLGDISITIDGTPMEAYDTASCLCYMLGCHAANYTSGSINLCGMIEAMRQQVLTTETDIRTFVEHHATTIVDKCNHALTDSFMEKFQIGLEDDKYNIYIEESTHGLRSCVNHNSYFNEAKLHLVNLLLQLVAIRLMTDTQPADTARMLVMDDVVTSLDSANRRFLIHYLLDDYSDMQMLVMTHNIGFNNVFYNIAKEKRCTNSWHFVNLYLNDGGPHLYDYVSMRTATGIKRAYMNGEVDLSNIGTMIRRRFEALLMEVSKILSIGASEEASTLINRLLNPDKPIYIRKHDGKILLADDLVRKIRQDLADGMDDPHATLLGIIAEIDSYHTEESLGLLIPIIRQFREYEKLVLHELSHGCDAMPTFQQKEVEASLVLLEEMEHCVKSLRLKNAGM